MRVSDRRKTIPLSFLRKQESAFFSEIPAFAGMTGRVTKCVSQSGEKRFEKSFYKMRVSERRKNDLKNRFTKCVSQTGEKRFEKSFYNQRKVILMKHKKWIVFFILNIFGWLYAIPAVYAETFAELFAQGQEFYRKGDMGHAAQLWEQIINSDASEKDPALYEETLIFTAQAYQALGHQQKALSLLQDSLPFIEKRNDKENSALFFSALGDAYLSIGNMTEAFEYLSRGVEEARVTENPRILATVLNNFANVFVADENYQGAADIYDECLKHISAAGGSDPDISVLKADVLINLLFVMSEAGNSDNIRTALNDASSYIGNLPDDYVKAVNLISLNTLIRKIKPEDYDAEKLSALRYRLLKDARQIAESLKNNRLLSYSYGYMGQLYEDRSRREEAAALTQQAIFFAEQENCPEISYLWQWQSGRLCAERGDIENAVKVYYKAVSVLNPVRQSLYKGYRSRKDAFNESIKPVYLELAELLLEQAETLKGEAQESKIREARDVMELLKTAELESFFADECVRTRNVTTLDRTDAGTAVIYPILLPKKPALLLTLPDGMKYVRIPADAESLRQTVMRFREHLQTRPTNQFFYEAQQLYDWLIRPIESLLTEHKIDTLLVVPDGVLRLIPFAALHDGRGYLVGTYAVGTLPAVTLTDFRSDETPDHSEILIAGLSESVQDFPPLPDVPRELEDVRRIMNGKTVLLNGTYTLDNLTGEFKKNPYSYIHLATHGVFSGTVGESFLLTYNGSLSMNQLEEIIRLGNSRKQPVELLTLSACQTAQGDERAAMGLAGVALKAGVKAALATLWYVDDEATALAVRDFYQELKIPGISKAKALQNAQKKLMGSRRYRHPGYWAPFLLIGK